MNVSNVHNSLNSAKIAYSNPSKTAGTAYPLETSGGQQKLSGLHAVRLTVTRLSIIVGILVAPEIHMALGL